MEPARWLTTREEQAWRLFVAVLMLVPGEVEAQLKRDAGLTQVDYGVLSALSEAPGRAMRMNELARMVNGSRPRMSQVVAKLERRGWVRREPTREDGRGSLAVLTDAGYAQVVAIAPGHVAAVREAVVDALSPEQLDQLAGISATLLDALEARRSGSS
ncbi:MarR family winged helix-turn-helix transcriptional regulator, partial [Actinoplanes subtropicus]|uniref:MarR family winged helix-turn-helix transcriptional regulator n=1 Tax=Actinoplanes subtropicus TaxID=543632 RepID=UPI0004C31037